jgi:tetratricopeptide (TPR) repeat protein
MATKEVMVSAPLVVLLYDRAFCAGSLRAAWRRRYGLYLCLASTWLLPGWLEWSMGTLSSEPGLSDEDFTWWSYLWTQPGVILHYLRLALWPANLCLDYAWHAAQNVGDVLWPALVVIGLWLLTIWALVKQPGWGMLGIWFFAVLAPSSSFLPLEQAAFEHRMYLPLAAMVTGVVVGGFLAGRWLVRRGVISRLAAQVIGGTLVLGAAAALGSITFDRNLDYRSEFAIWADTAAKAPNNPRACYNVGVILAARGKIDEAIAQYNKALEIKPNYARAHGNLGSALARSGRIDEAIVQYQTVMKIDPGDAMAYNNIAWIRATRPDPKYRDGAQAVALATRAVELDKNNANFLDTLATAYAEAGRFAEALETAERAVALAASQNDAALADVLRTRVQLYRRHSPYRDLPPPAGSPSGGP